MKRIISVEILDAAGQVKEKVDTVGSVLFGQRQNDIIGAGVSFKKLLQDLAPPGRFTNLNFTLTASIKIRGRVKMRNFRKPQGLKPGRLKARRAQGRAAVAVRRQDSLRPIGPAPEKTPVTWDTYLEWREKHPNLDPYRPYVVQRVLTQQRLLGLEVVMSPLIPEGKAVLHDPTKSPPPEWLPSWLYDAPKPKLLLPTARVDRMMNSKTYAFLARRKGKRDSRRRWRQLGRRGR